MLVEMMVWGARYCQTGASPEVIREMTEDREGFVAALRERHASDDREPAVLPSAAGLARGRRAMPARPGTSTAGRRDRQHRTAERGARGASR